MYNASCFVECVKNGSDFYKISFHNLEQFEIQANKKDLKEVQEMLKSFMIKTKVIIVFTNKKN